MEATSSPLKEFAMELRTLLKILNVKIQFLRKISLLENVSSLNKVSLKNFSGWNVKRERKENAFLYGSFFLRKCIDLLSHSLVLVFLHSFSKLCGRLKRAEIM
jgi:hypothetical protein